MRVVDRYEDYFGLRTRSMIVDIRDIANIANIANISYINHIAITYDTRNKEQGLIRVHATTRRENSYFSDPECFDDIIFNSYAFRDLIRETDFRGLDGIESLEAKILEYVERMLTGMYMK